MQSARSVGSTGSSAPWWYASELDSVKKLTEQHSQALTRLEANICGLQRRLKECSHVLVQERCDRLEALMKEELHQQDQSNLRTAAVCEGLKGTLEAVTGRVIETATGLETLAGCVVEMEGRIQKVRHDNVSKATKTIAEEVSKRFEELLVDEPSRDEEAARLELNTKRLQQFLAEALDKSFLFREGKSGVLASSTEQDKDPHPSSQPTLSASGSAADAAAGGVGTAGTVPSAENAVSAGVIGDISMYITSIIDSSVQQSERRMLAKLASVRALREQQHTPRGVESTNSPVAGPTEVRTRQQVHQHKQWPLGASQHAHAAHQGSASQRTHSAAHPSQWHQALAFPGALNLTGTACTRSAHSEPPMQVGVHDRAPSPLRGISPLRCAGTQAAAVGSPIGPAPPPIAPVVSGGANNSGSGCSSIAAAAVAARRTVPRLALPVRDNPRTRQAPAFQSPLVSRSAHRMSGRGLAQTMTTTPRTTPRTR